jgi:hypothetical protein
MRVSDEGRSVQGLVRLALTITITASLAAKIDLDKVQTSLRPG